MFNLSFFPLFLPCYKSRGFCFLYLISPHVFLFASDHYAFLPNAMHNAMKIAYSFPESSHARKYGESAFTFVSKNSTVTESTLMSRSHTVPVSSPRTHVISAARHTNSGADLIVWLADGTSAFPQFSKLQLGDRTIIVC